MNERPIDRFSLRYHAFRTYSMIASWIFYRRVQTKFRDRIPKGVPVIFAPNHQNALMDALEVVFSSRRNPVFVMALSLDWTSASCHAPYAPGPSHRSGRRPSCGDTYWAERHARAWHLCRVKKVAPQAVRTWLCALHPR